MSLSRKKILILDLRMDIPASIVEQDRTEVNNWFLKKRDQVQNGWKSIERIFNDTDEISPTSPRLQVTIDGRSALHKSKLLSEYLLPYLNHWGEQSGLSVTKVLLLISEAGCPQQLPHIDDNTGTNDFIVGLFTLQNATHFVLQNESMEGTPLQDCVFNANTMILFHSTKLHAGGMNLTDGYNFRYHFRLEKRSGVRKANAAEVGFLTHCKWRCGKWEGNHENLKKHQQFCEQNPDGKANRDRKNMNERLRLKRKRGEKSALLQSDSSASVQK